MKKKICVLGMGYIGLPTASIFAANGFSVIGVDTNESVVSLLQSGKTHIEEPGLKTLVQAAIHSKNLLIASEPDVADVYIIAVPTPFKENKKPDLSFVEAATKSILPLLKRNDLVILESTSPPGTTRTVLGRILEEKGFSPGKDVLLAHCPERVLPGRILKELIENDRIIGGINGQSAQVAADLYSCIVQGNIFTTDTTTAEMAKLVENTYRDVNIAFVNELAIICESLGISVWEVIDLANKHPRVNLHTPGPGVGGHCIAVDPWFIVSENPTRSELIQAARKINDSMPEFVVSKIFGLIKGIDNPKVTILGVAYKADVDDTRESPAVRVYEDLKASPVELSVYDPHVKFFEYDLSDFETAFEDSDLIAVLTDHKEFKYLDPEEIIKLVRTPNVLDTKNCLNKEKWEKNKFKIHLLGSDDQTG